MTGSTVQLAHIPSDTSVTLELVGKPDVHTWSNTNVVTKTDQSERMCALFGPGRRSHLVEAVVSLTGAVQ